MITYTKPYFMKNPNWFYFDARKDRMRLTDKATQKAVDSFVDFYYKISISSCPVEVPVKYWYDVAKEDIEDFKKNKQRYELRPDEFGEMELAKIDGEDIKLEDV